MSEVKVGDIVYTEGASAILGDVAEDVGDGQFIVNWRPTRTTERLEDLLVDEDAMAQRRRDEDGPTDDELYNRPGVEGGIAYAMDDAPGSLGENDWRL